MRATATAPCRIDLAGGTIDVWPVCFALDRPAVTVNAAIDLRARAIAEDTGDGFLHVVSEDRGEEVRLPVDAITHERLGLATRLAAWLGCGDGLKLTLRSGPPPQSGLGGSSTLAVAIAGAIGLLRGVEPELRAIQDVETALLGVPTGYQDYVPPRHGGVHAIRAAPGAPELERLEGAGAFLARHLLLVDTRVEHQSGMNNWEVARRFLDGDIAVHRSMNRIRDLAEEMRAAVAARDPDALARVLAAEWTERRRLAPVVSNPAIERLLDAARRAGARAGKVCGAGGGGCMVLAVDDTAGDTVAPAVRAAGGRTLDFRPDDRGLSVRSQGRNGGF